MLMTPPPGLQGLVGRRGAGTPENLWLDELPPEWRDVVAMPVRFVRHREIGIAATRTLGYDADDLRCFYHHSYLITELRTEPGADGGDDLHPLVTRGETLRAWRLRDDRWLAWRIVCRDDGGLGRGFYSFSPTCPR